MSKRDAREGARSGALLMAAKSAFPTVPSASRPSSSVLDKKPASDYASPLPSRPASLPSDHSAVGSARGPSTSNGSLAATPTSPAAASHPSHRPPSGEGRSEVHRTLPSARAHDTLAASGAPACLTCGRHSSADTDTGQLARHCEALTASLANAANTTKGDRLHLLKLTEQLAAAHETIARMRAALAASAKSAASSGVAGAAPSALDSMRVDGTAVAPTGPTIAEFQALQERLSAVMTSERTLKEQALAREAAVLAAQRDVKRAAAEHTKVAEGLRATLAACQQQHAGCSASIATLTSTLSDTQAQLASTERSLQLAEESKSSAFATLQQLEQQLSHATAQMQAQSQEHTGALQQLQHELEVAQIRVQELTTAASAPPKAAACVQCRTLQSDLVASVASESALRRSAADLQSKLAQLQGSHDRVTVELAAAKAEAQRQREHRHAVVAETVHSLRQQVASLTTTLATRPLTGPDALPVPMHRSESLPALVSHEPLAVSHTSDVGVSGGGSGVGMGGGRAGAPSHSVSARALVPASAAGTWSRPAMSHHTAQSSHARDGRDVLSLDPGSAAADGPAPSDYLRSRLAELGCGELIPELGASVDAPARFAEYSGSSGAGSSSGGETGAGIGARAGPGAGALAGIGARAPPASGVQLSIASSAEPLPVDSSAHSRMPSGAVSPITSPTRGSGPVLQRDSSWKPQRTIRNAMF